jgi:hypothetical protein
VKYVTIAVKLAMDIQQKNVYLVAKGLYIKIRFKKNNFNKKNIFLKNMLIIRNNP